MARGLKEIHRKGKRLLELGLVRTRKYLSQRRRFHRADPTTPVFLVGCHRSGTNMCMNVFEKSPDVWLYNESNRLAFFNYRLLAPEVITRRIERCFAPVVLFKPLSDSHLVDHLLNRYPGGKAFWIYRGYGDTINSAVRAWGDHHKDIMRRIVAGDIASLGWRAERLTSAQTDLIKSHYRDEMTAEEGAALLWYLRHEFYFRLGLESNERVMLLKYEDLVTNPQKEFARMFDFAGVEFRPEFVSHVFSSSIGKNRQPALNAELTALCNEMQNRLDACYAEHRSAAQKRAA